MKTFLTILGCGSSMGVPRADGFGDLVIKIIKKITELEVPLLSLEETIIF